MPIAIKSFQYQAYQGLYITSGVLLFIILLFGGMRCVILGEKLYLKMWFISGWSTNISDIISIKRSYIPLSAHAASLKRLSIKLRAGVFTWWLISPVREKEFIEALKAINPNVEVSIPEKTGKWWRIWDWDI